jgi:hypothetical protein
MMDKKDNRSGTFEVGEYTFKRAELGLDEGQVASTINQLLSQRDTLVKRQEHLLALSQLAERTVAEADELAKKFKKEAEEQAEADAKAILAKAEEQSQQMIELKVAETMASAQEEAANIRADAEKHAEAMLKERAQRLQSQMRETAQRLCHEMSTQADSFKQQIAAFETNFEQELSELEGFSYQEIPKQSDNTATETKSEVVTETEPPPLETILEPVGDEEHVTLEILPPRDLNEIAKIKTYLESLPAVKTTELLNYTDKTVIEVFLAERTNLTEKLHELPLVESTEEVTDNGHKKIQIHLSLVSPLEVTKTKLGKSVSRILSHKP